MTRGFQRHPLDGRIDSVAFQSVIMLKLSHSRIGRFRARDNHPDRHENQQEELARAFHIHVSGRILLHCGGDCKNGALEVANSCENDSEFSRANEVVAARWSVSLAVRSHPLIPPESCFRGRGQNLEKVAGRAAQLGINALAVRGDSELVVKQVTGVYKVKNAALKPIAEQVTGVLRAFDGLQVA